VFHREGKTSVSVIPLRRIEGKYEILEKIREGGMGAIYKVRHRLLDEVRVIKVMRPQLTEDEELKERFLREARLAIKLRHPNIAQLYDFTVDEETGSAFIVMELIQGTTLEDLLALHGPPPLGLALEIAQQSLRALGYLHGKGFVHRDISPDNLMLAEDAEGGPAIKLIDLGIAKTLDTTVEKNLTHTGTFLGKVRYASPEQFGFEGTTQIDARGDLYSFGLVFYELLTGRYPVQGRDPSSIIAGHLFRPPLDFKESDPGGRIPDALRAVVLQALAKDPGARFASAAEMSRALAPLRQPGDVPEADLRRMLATPIPLPVQDGAALVPGSTQQRLDEQFGLRSTPRPLPLEAVPAAAPAETAVLPRNDPARSDAALAAALAGIETALTEGHAAEAEALLFEAEAVHGHRETFAPLYDRLEELHRLDLRRRTAAAIDRQIEQGNLEAAVKLLTEADAGEEPDPELEELRQKIITARRTARVDAAVAEIRELLDRGDLEEAAQRLDRAVSRYGGADALRAQWERLETLQRPEREEKRLRAERRRQQEDPQFVEVLEAAQRVAELLAQRDTTHALQELRAATTRFGERPELAALRKRLAGMVLE
jgi:eukaryotic-like serine/threonine-protein kinase